MKKSSPATDQKISGGDPSWRIGIVASEYYPEEVDSLIESARSALLEAGIPERNISVHRVSGAFEIPLIGGMLSEQRSVDGLIGLGIVVEGETEHARLVAEAAAHGIMDVQTNSGTPFAFEVLLVKTLSLAQARLGKGREAAATVLRSLRELQAIRK